MLHLVRQLAIRTGTQVSSRRLIHRSTQQNIGFLPIIAYSSLKLAAVYFVKFKNLGDNKYLVRKGPGIKDTGVDKWGFITPFHKAIVIDGAPKDYVTNVSVLTKDGKKMRMPITLKVGPTKEQISEYAEYIFEQIKDQKMNLIKENRIDDSIVYAIINESVQEYALGTHSLDIHVLIKQFDADGSTTVPFVSTIQDKLSGIGLSVLEKSFDEPLYTKKNRKE